MSDLQSPSKSMGAQTGRACADEIAKQIVAAASPARSSAFMPTNYKASRAAQMMRFTPRQKMSEARADFVYRACARIHASERRARLCAGIHACERLATTGQNGDL